MSEKEKRARDQAPDSVAEDAAEARAAGTEEAPAEDLRPLLEDARAKADEHFEQVLRLQAELDNLRKRSARDLESAHKYALDKFMLELLPVRDSLELGLAAAGEGDSVDPAKLREGTELTLKMFADAMSKFGAEQIDPQGERFNPELHQAMSMQEAPGREPNTVLTVVQKGYRLNDRLIRPALVIVSSGGGAAREQGGAAYQPGTGGGNLDEQA